MATHDGLQQCARSRADAKAKAAEKSWRELQARDELEAAWDDIYVSAPHPLTGEHQDYATWVKKLTAFDDAVKRAGYEDKFLSAQPPGDAQRKALSIVQAGISGGAQAITDRIAELDDKHDDREWKEVFRNGELLWRALEPWRWEFTSGDGEPQKEIAKEATTDPPPRCRAADSVQTNRQPASGEQ